MAELYVGAHLVTSRGVYSHHGIYLGDYRVIHSSGLSDGLKAGPIEIVDLAYFKQDSDLVIRRYKDPKYRGDEVVRRAKSRLGEDKYDLQANNCEHFCTWAVTGERNSSQVGFVEDVVDIAGGTILGTAMRMRKHYMQGFDAKEVAKDAGNTAAMVAIGAVFPITIPAMLGWKVLRKVFGK